MPFPMIFVASLVAVALLVALAAWANIGRTLAPLTEAEAEARARLAEEFPGERPDGLWIAADRRSAVGRAGDTALVLFRVGDGYAARRLAWRALGAGGEDRRVRLGHASTPRLSLDFGGAWPPTEAGA